MLMRPGSASRLHDAPTSPALMTTTPSARLAHEAQKYASWFPIVPWNALL
jgi:hypothetical protein